MVVNILERLHFKAKGNEEKYKHKKNKESKPATKLQDSLDEYMRGESLKWV